MALPVTVPTSDPIDMTNGRLRQEWRIFFNQLNDSVNTAATSGASAITNLQTALSNETAAREAADAQLLPINGGRTGQIGFQGSPPQPRLEVIGSRGGIAALQTLLIQLARYGLIVDHST